VSEPAAGPRAPHPFEIQAHRGARSLFPENTLPAFIAAADLGVRVVEFDLTVSADMQLVVAHDPWIETLGGWRPIHAMHSEEVARYDCGEPDPRFPRQLRVRASRPHLREVFRAVERHLEGAARPMTYNLELKSWSSRDGLLHPPPDIFVRLVLECAGAAGLLERIRIQSFDSRVVRAARFERAAVECGLLVEESFSLRPALRRLGFRPDWLNPRHTLVTPDLVRHLHALGIRTAPWTVNDPGEMLRLHRLGADGLITDHPERALALFATDGANRYL